LGRSTSRAGSLGLVLILAFVLLAAFPHVDAQDCIAVEGFKWSRTFVGIYIAEGTNGVQKQQPLYAMSTWFSAQTWFISSYQNQQGTPYLLYLADAPGNGVITLSFFIGEGENFGGRTIYSLGGQYPNVQIQINLTPDHAQNPNDLFVEDVILHELGHALGLGHTQNPQDAMYPSVDSTPQSYGLPSTLDLAALYELSQTSDVSSLGGLYCLSGTVAYGFPPWIQQTQNTIVLQIPTYEPSAHYSAVFSMSEQTANIGDTVRVTVVVTNAGTYPLQMVSATVQPDFGLTATPDEAIPLEVDPGTEGTLTFSVMVPPATSYGQHQLILALETIGLTTEGWSSNPISKSASLELTVSQPQSATSYQASSSANTNAGEVVTCSPSDCYLVVGSSTLVTVAQQPNVLPTQASENYWGTIILTPMIVAAVLVFVYFQRKSKKSSNRRTSSV